VRWERGGGGGRKEEEAEIIRKRFIFPEVEFVLTLSASNHAGKCLSYVKTLCKQTVEPLLLTSQQRLQHFRPPPGMRLR